MNHFHKATADAYKLFCDKIRSNSCECGSRPGLETGQLGVETNWFTMIITIRYDANLFLVVTNNNFLP